MSNKQKQPFLSHALSHFIESINISYQKQVYLFQCKSNLKVNVFLIGSFQSFFEQLKSFLIFISYTSADSQIFLVSKKAL